MSMLHAHRSRPYRAGVFILLLCAALQVHAVPPGGYDYAVRCGVDMERGADEDAYYLEIGFDDAVATEVATRLRGRLLRVHVRQYSDGRAGSCGTRMNKGVTLPRDADGMLMRRHDEPGRVLFIIPRRQPYWP